MSSIVVKDITRQEAEERGIFKWSTWGCGVSTFDWSYDESETAYLLEGEVEVTASGETVRFGAGQLVYFPAGLDCVWSVKKPVRKHYKFGLPQE